MQHWSIDLHHEYQVQIEVDLEFLDVSNVLKPFDSRVLQPLFLNKHPQNQFQIDHLQILPSKNKSSITSNPRIARR